MPSQEKFNQVAGEVNSIGWAVTHCQVGSISAPIQVYIFRNKSIQNEAILGTDFIHQFQLELRPDFSIHQIIDNQSTEIESNLTWSRKMNIDFIKHFSPHTLLSAVHSLNQNNAICTNKSNIHYSNISRKDRKSLKHKFIHTDQEQCFKTINTISIKTNQEFNLDNSLTLNQIQIIKETINQTFFHFTNMT